MKQLIRILHVEDEPDYSELVRSLLEQDGFKVEMTIVADGPAFETALARASYDIILADYSLPNYDGLQALRYSQERAPETPFLLVSGNIAEQQAIESLKEGLTDYVLKQWPERLVPAIRRALNETAERTQRHEAEHKLRHQEKCFRSLTENSLDILSVLDREGCLVFTSPSVHRVLGYMPTDLAGKCVFELIHPDDLPRVQAVFAEGLSDASKLYTLAFRCRHKDGSWRHLEAVGQNRLEDGDIAGVVVNSRDVTERKKIEHRNAVLSRLGQSLSSASSPAEAAQIIRSVADELFCWDAFVLNLYENSRDEVIHILVVDTDRDGNRFDARPHGESQRPSPMARRVIEHGAEIICRENPVTMPADVNPIGDTSRPSASLMLVPIRSGAKVIGILSIQSYAAHAYDEQDLAALQTLADYCGGALDRIRAEQALHDSEQRFRQLFEASPDAIFVEDYSGTVLDVNPAACWLHGLTRDELIGTSVVDLVPEDQRDKVMRDFQSLVDGKRTQVEGTSWSLVKGTVPVEICVNRIEYGGSKAVLLHVRDITERTRAEAALRSSELLFHSVWENSVDGMRLTDEEGNIVAVNDAYGRLVGSRREDLEGRPFTVVYEDSEESEKFLSSYREQFKNGLIEKHVERRLKLRNGTVVTLEETNSFVGLQGQKPLLLALFRDVTVQRRLEDQLRQAQKMEAIGQLAGGVAHDFNNILTVIHGHASLLLLGGSLSGAPARSAEQITQAADKAASLTRQLLAFSRRQLMQLHRLDMNEVVSDMTKMLGRILGEDIALQLHYSPQPAFVDADAGMMEQILLNLTVNSRDAMPRGGVLAIRISHAEISAQHIPHHEARPGSFVCLSVTDKGCGIPPENLRRIFDPFFTTKEVGKGTGLGLATVYGIVKQHQGWIEVASEVNKGTTFSVFLPRVASPAAQPEQALARPSVRGGSETILVVEDEAPVRELVCSLLAAHGYQILQAESGTKALELWASCKEKVDLVLTDLVMPDRVNGRELAEKLWVERPKLKVIFTSGYSAEVVGKDFVLRRGLNYLQKPYHPDKLANTVRECLDARN